MGVGHRGSRDLSGRLLALLLAAGCASLPLPWRDAEEEQRLAVFRENASTYYDAGRYTQALHSANQALTVDEDDVDMLLVRGMCLLKLGQANDRVDLIDQSLALFSELADDWSDGDDFRVHFGAGQAHLARALAADAEVDRIGRRLDEGFLKGAARDAELAQQRLAGERRREHLEAAETHLRTVLDDPRQRDNRFALMDLVLVLSSLGDRDDEVIALAERTLALLDESSRLTRVQLENLVNLSAEGRLSLERRIETNLAKERLLRDLIATVHFNRRDYDAFLAQMDALERRQLMTNTQYYNRAQVYEEQGRYAEAIADLEQCLRKRALVLDFESDPLAGRIFDRLERLRTKTGGSARR